MRWLRHPWLYRIVSLALGAVFLYAAHDKILNPQSLVTIMWGYRLLPAGPINLVAIYMPWLELLVGLALVTGYKRQAAATWASVLLVTFTIALLVNAIRGINVACGCFSTNAQDVHNAWLLVLRDLPMLAAALFLAVSHPRPAQPSR